VQECDELLRQQAEHSARHHQATEALARVRHTLHERTTQLKQLEEEVRPVVVCMCMSNVRTEALGG
jgi:hypothetical protein